MQGGGGGGEGGEGLSPAEGGKGDIPGRGPHFLATRPEPLHHPTPHFAGTSPFPSPPPPAGKPLRPSLFRQLPFLRFPPPPSHAATRGSVPPTPLHPSSTA